MEDRMMTLDYTRQRAAEVLKGSRRAVLATAGPAGVLASEIACQAVGLDLYLLVPQTSDHLFNLENNPAVTLLAAGWTLKGTAQLIFSPAPGLAPDLWQEPGAAWCALVHVDPCQVQIRREAGWGNLETLDLKSPWR